jgi:CRISPR-associated protein Cas1
MTGLDASLRFLHEHQPATPPLVYDFDEPYRWLVDHTVLKIILERRFSWDDFCFSGHYELRIDRLLLDRFMDLLRGQFNSGVVYRDKADLGHVHLSEMSGAGSLSVEQSGQV